MPGPWDWIRQISQRAAPMALGLPTNPDALRRMVTVPQLQPVQPRPQAPPRQPAPPPTEPPEETDQQVEARRVREIQPPAGMSLQQAEEHNKRELQSTEDYLTNFAIQHGISLPSFGSDMTREQRIEIISRAIDSDVSRRTAEGEETFRRVSGDPPAGPRRHEEPTAEESNIDNMAAIEDRVSRMSPEEIRRLQQLLRSRRASPR